MLKVHECKTFFPSGCANKCPRRIECKIHEGKRIDKIRADAMGQKKDEKNPLRLQINNVN